MDKIKELLQKFRSIIQKIRIEFFVLGSFVMSFIVLITNFYKLRMGEAKVGFSILDAKLGCLIFLLILGGYAATLVFCSLDNDYSKRARLSFQGTIGFIVLLFFGSIIWIVAKDDTYFGKEEIFGVAIRGGFGFAFYWFFIHIITSGIIALLYQTYEGTGERSAYRWIMKIQGIEVNQKVRYVSKYEELKKIKELLDQGILTEEEYLKEKQTILNRQD